MYDLESIIAQNKRAEALGIIKPGSAVGTTGYRDPSQRANGRDPNVADGGPRGHSEWQGGLRGHSIGDDYPFSVVGIGLDGWRVQNLMTGEEFETYEGPGACERAHDKAHELKVLSQTTFTRNEEY